jgi:hypothetical protein
VGFATDGSELSGERAKRVVEDMRQLDEAYNRVAERAAADDAESESPTHHSDSSDALGPSATRQSERFEADWQEQGWPDPRQNPRTF